MGAWLRVATDGSAADPSDLLAVVTVAHNADDEEAAAVAPYPDLEVRDSAAVEPREVADQPAWTPPARTATGQPPMRVRVLGPARVDAWGQPVNSGLRASTYELLAYDLLHPDGATAEAANPVVVDADMWRRSTHMASPATLACRARPRTHHRDDRPRPAPGPPAGNRGARRQRVGRAWLKEGSSDAAAANKNETERTGTTDRSPSGRGGRAVSNVELTWLRGEHVSAGAGCRALIAHRAAPSPPRVRPGSPPTPPVPR